MGYLVYNDYAVTIQDSAFKQWIASNDALRVQAEPRAQAKIKEYLVQKYDLATEFKSTTIFKETVIYQANALIQLNYPAWVNTTASYSIGDYVSYIDGNVYRCIMATTSAHELPTNATYWALVGTQLGLYYLQYPYGVFNYKSVYVVGDKVFWKGKIYQCLIPTTLPGHATLLQDGTYADVPNYNIFPDDASNGLTYWGAGKSYSVVGLRPNVTQPTWSGITSYTIGDRVTYNGVTWEAITNNLDKIPGIDITNWQSETWTYGDNRNQSILDAYVAITLYYLAFRIAPKVLPEWVKNKYDAAMTWLQSSADGTITLDVPEIQPVQGGRIRFGGTIKQINGY